MLSLYFAAASLTPQPFVPPLLDVSNTRPFAPEPSVPTVVASLPGGPKIQVADPASAPVADPVTAPVAAPVAAPVVDAATAPVGDPAAAPVVDPAPDTNAAQASAPADDDPAFTEARIPGDADPLAPINRISYAISQPIDRFILRPAAIVYTKVVPKPARDGARNAIQNLSEPLVIFNDLVQLHPHRAVAGVVRFLINSVFGIGGLIDVAKRKPFHIRHHANGFGDTLGYYGVGPILYLYLPVLGPTTLRDTAGDFGDAFAQPRILYKITHPDSDRPIWRNSLNLGKTGTVIRVVDGLDKRAEVDQELESIRRDSVDPYATLRASYLQDRAGEIAALKAKPVAEGAVLDPVDPATDPLADPLPDPDRAPPK
ncbi:MlaA family lipoprotein [Novosphingobium lentum]|uniref:MlaA family lipoprotein n=1 Tax=Novosphingobium lentum TaxID=145287 RepID=UPI000834EA04|nr:VacJ family lipoprotein [Novosphingobium lentum]